MENSEVRMIKEDPYKVRFEKLLPWSRDIFQPIRKDLKNEHLLKTPSFAQKHFPKRHLDKLTTEEMAAAYLREIAEGNEEMGEKVVTRWVMKNAGLYQFFATELSKINPQFDAIESFSPEVGAFLLNASVARYGAVAAYLFCVMNTVVFTEEQMQKLREMALAETETVQPQTEQGPPETVQAVKEHYEKLVRRITEKWEHRLQGLERKYVQDTEGLKKQIAQLHRKLGSISVGT
jgi:hypothetical protein